MGNARRYGYRYRNPDAPASKKQIEHAIELGVTVPKGITMAEIGDLIDEAKANRKPSSDQLEFAAKLGIQVPEGMGFYELSDLIDAEVKRLTIIAMRTNPALCAGKVIMYNGLPYRIDDLNGRERFRAVLVPLRTGVPGYGRVRVLIIKIADVHEVDPEKLRKALV